MIKWFLRKEQFGPQGRKLQNATKKVVGFLYERLSSRLGLL
jgi:hypothetical protein